MKLKFFHTLSGEKKVQISDFFRMCPVGEESFHADGRTDMMKLIVTFHNVANAPKDGTK